MIPVRVENLPRGRRWPVGIDDDGFISGGKTMSVDKSLGNPTLHSNMDKIFTNNTK